MSRIGLSGRGGGGLRRSGAGGLGLVAVVVVGWFFGLDLTPPLSGVGPDAGAGGRTAPRPQVHHIVGHR
jgi:hypothetical protein